jgi:nitrate reductase (NAD(P)H)
MGRMNNCRYTITTEISEDDEDARTFFAFRNPCGPAGDGGWMRPQFRESGAECKQQAGTPQKHFTRQEIEKHNNKSDCRPVIDTNVYDATSVLGYAG